MRHSDVAIIIPSRISSTRLNQKPLQCIGSLTIIERVLGQVQKTGLDNIYVATDSKKIAFIVEKVGGKAILTDGDIITGTERCFAAFTQIPNNTTIDYIINVQGDMPFIEPESILKIIEELKKNDDDIVTPVVRVNKKDVEAVSNVAVVVNLRGKAMYFSRNLIPHGADEFLYHVGMYGFRRASLERFVSLPPTLLEKSERLEQLRALEHGMTIGTCLVQNVPISVDTEEDLEKAVGHYITHHS